MRIQKWFSILILLGLLIIPLSGQQIAAAEGDSPPVTDDASGVIQDNADVSQLTDGTGVAGNQSYMSGTDPNQGTSTSSRQVEVTIPASPQPKNGINAASAANLPRPESTVTITQSLTYVPGPDVLLVIADDDLTAGYTSPIQLLLQAYGDLGSVDLFNAMTGTPTLVDLLDYDVVVTCDGGAAITLTTSSGREVPRATADIAIRSAPMSKRVESSMTDVMVYSAAK